MKFIDQLDRSLFLDKTPERIICLVPSLSELLVDLGLASKLVGITKFCVHPEYLRKEKAVVGGTKSVHFDQILTLKPDIILCNKEENTQELVAGCEKIATTHVSDIQNLDDVYALVLQYGNLFEVTQKAKLLVESIEQKAAIFRGSVKNTSSQKVAYLIWRKPFMAAGKDTFINYLLEMNGFQNVFTEKKSRYPEVELQELAKADLILLSSEPFPFAQKHIDEISAHTKAKIMLVDGEYFSWYGSRLLGAFDYFTKLQKELT
jgi:ABC-type Fe3+-hydroxamate transport system substrate-binding protein